MSSVLLPLQLARKVLKISYIVTYLINIREYHYAVRPDTYLVVLKKVGINMLNVLFGKSLITRNAIGYELRTHRINQAYFQLI